MSLGGRPMEKRRAPFVAEDNAKKEEGATHPMVLG